MLEDSSKPALGVLFSPQKSDQVRHALGMVRSFVALNIEIPEGRGVAEPMLRVKFCRLARACWVTAFEAVPAFVDRCHSRSGHDLGPQTWYAERRLASASLHPAKPLDQRQPCFQYLPRWRP